MKYFLLAVLLLNSSIFLGCAGQNLFFKEKQPDLDPNSHEAKLQLLTEQIVISLSEKKKAKIAIIEFYDLQGNVNDFGRYLSEELITRLFLTKKFEVIERQMLNKVMKEHQLALTGLIDESSAKELGRILGVDAIASGSISDLGNNVKVNARLISTETGEIFSVASVTFLKDEVVTKLLDSSGTSQDQQKVSSEQAADTDKGTFNSVVNKNQFSFELLSCVKENRTVYMDLNLTNRSEKDVDIFILLHQTKFYDQSGNEYITSVAKIANSTSIKGRYKLDKQIVAGTTVPLTLIFEDVSSASDNVSLLNIKFGYELGDIKFRNFPIEMK